MYTSAMTAGIQKLLTSKRVWIALIVAILDILVILGVFDAIPTESVNTVVTALTTLAGIIITAITGTDIVAGISTPDGFDHKGRPIIDVAVVSEKPKG